MKKFDLFKPDNPLATPKKNLDALKKSALAAALLNKIKGGESGSGSDGESGCDRRRRTGGG